MIYDSLFNIDLNRLAVELIPTKWRNPIFVAWVKVLASPFIVLLNQLKEHRRETIYRLQHNARVGSIEKVLNDKFDYIERRIRIGDGAKKDHLFVHFPSESKPPTYTDFPVYTLNEVIEFSADFVVLVPQGIIESDLEKTRMEAIVSYYADKDKHFIIKEI